MAGCASLEDAQTAKPVELAAAVVVGLKPPPNQPQVTPCSFSRSPTLRDGKFGSLKAAPSVGAPPQSSRPESASPTIVKPLPPSETRTPPAMASASTCASMAGVTSLPAAWAPWVWPEMRLIAPGVDGPKVVPKELSLIEKFCA